MAVRGFDPATSDAITLALGAAGGIAGGAFTVAFLIDWDTSDDGGPLYAQGSGGVEYGLGVDNAFEHLRLRVDDVTRTFANVGDARADGWHLFAVSKDAGASIPRMHQWDKNDLIWTHVDGDGTLGDGTTTLQSFKLGTRANAAFLDGRLAVVGLFPHSYTNAGIEAAGLESALQNWLDQGAIACWPLNQESVSTPVEDITGGGANEIAITGTTVVVGSDPPDFDWTLGTAVPEVTAEIPLTLSLDATTEAVHDVTASIPLSLDVSATTDAPTIGIPEVTAEIPLTLAMSGTAEAVHEVSSEIPLALTASAVATATHEATAEIPLTVTMAAEAASTHEVTAAIAMTLSMIAQTFTEVPSAPGDLTLTALPETLTLAAIPNTLTLRALED